MTVGVSVGLCVKILIKVENGIKLDRLCKSP